MLGFSGLTRNSKATAGIRRLLLFYEIILSVSHCKDNGLLFALEGSLPVSSSCQTDNSAWVKAINSIAG